MKEGVDAQGAGASAGGVSPKLVELARNLEKIVGPKFITPGSIDALATRLKRDRGTGASMEDVSSKLVELARNLEKIAGPQFIAPGSADTFAAQLKGARLADTNIRAFINDMLSEDIANDPNKL
jgi:hypothetical protein